MCSWMVVVAGGAKIHPSLFASHTPSNHTSHTENREKEWGFGEEWVGGLHV